MTRLPKWEVAARDVISDGGRMFMRSLIGPMEFSEGLECQALHWGSPH